MSSFDEVGGIVFVLAVASCARDLEIPSIPILDQPAISSSALGGYTKGEAEILGRSFTGPELGEPRVFFGSTPARVLDRTPERIVAEIPPLPLSTGETHISVRTRAGEARSETTFYYFGPGHLREDARITRSLSHPYQGRHLAVDPTSDRALVLLVGADLFAAIDSSGDVHWHTAVTGLDAAASSSGRLFVTARSGLIELLGLDRVRTIPLPGRPWRIGIAADGRSACLFYADPRGVGLLDLETEVASPITPFVEPVFLPTQPMPSPGGCFIGVVTTTDPLVTEVIDYRQSFDGPREERRYSIQNAFVNATVYSPDDGMIYAMHFGGITRVDLGSFSGARIDLGDLSGSSGLLVEGPPRLYAALPRQGQVMILSRPDLRPIGTFTVGTSPTAIGRRGDRLVVSQGSPLAVQSVDLETGAPISERELSLRATRLSPDFDGGGVVIAYADAPAPPSYYGESGSFIENFDLNFEGKLTALASTGPFAWLFAAGVETDAGPLLSAYEFRFVEDVPTYLHFSQPVSSPVRSLLQRGCFAPWPCGHGEGSALYALLEGDTSIDFARSPLEEGAFLEPFDVGLAAPSLLAAPYDAPLIAVAEPDGVAVVDAEQWTVRDRLPLEGPTALAFASNGHDVLAIADRRLFRSAGGIAALEEVALPHPVDVIEASPDGREVYLGSIDRPSVLGLDLESGAVRLIPTEGPCSALTIDIQGAFLYGIRADTGEPFLVE